MQESQKLGKPIILSLCQPGDHWKLIPGYVQAFSNLGYDLFCVGQDLAYDVPLSEILKICPQVPEAIFHFESARPLLPQGLTESAIPTMCFHADVYAYPERRLRWSYLFDHAAVFHPGYEDRFKAAGHPGAFLLPHAARREFYDLEEVERIYEVGWVGQSTGAIYRHRSRLLQEIVSRFSTNDWRASYTVQQVADVYRRSRVVVNVGRDDFPHDANLRVFEVLASGALLITSRPNELSDLGFQDGVHFVTYESDAEVVSKIRYFLGNEEERVRIANAGCEKTLREHTYDQRAKLILERLSLYSGQKLAPARFWPPWKGRLVSLDFFVAHQVLDCAKSEYFSNVLENTLFAAEGANLLARGYFRKYASLIRSALKI